MNLEVESGTVESLGNILAHFKKAKFEVTGAELIGVFTDIDKLFRFRNHLIEAKKKDDEEKLKLSKIPKKKAKKRTKRVVKNPVVEEKETEEE